MNPMLVQLQVMCPVVYEYSISIHIHIFTIYTIYGMPNTSKPISTWQCQKKGVFYRFSTATTLRGNTFHICSIIFGMTINVPNIFPSIYFFSDIVHKIPNFPSPKIATLPSRKKKESQASSKNSPWMLGECKSKSSWAVSKNGEIQQQNRTLKWFGGFLKWEPQVVPKSPWVSTPKWSNWSDYPSVS